MQIKQSAFHHWPFIQVPNNMGSLAKRSANVTHNVLRTLGKLSKKNVLVTLSLTFWYCYRITFS